MEPKPSDRDAGASPRKALGRLKRRAEFQHVSRGRRRAFATFTLQGAERVTASADEAAERARVGFTVTKKVGNAVVRNRIRRRLKAALAGAAPLEARADSDYVIVARRETLARPFAALVDDVAQAFRAIGRTDKARAAGRSDRDGRRAATPENPSKGKIRRP